MTVTDAITVFATAVKALVDSIDPQLVANVIAAGANLVSLS